MVKTGSSTLAALALFAACSSCAPTGTPPRNVVVLQSLAMGDRGCYAELLQSSGQTTVLMADFEVCGEEKLVGKKVTYTTKKEKVISSRCEGEPECELLEDVDLITQMVWADD